MAHEASITVSSSGTSNWLRMDASNGNSRSKSTYMLAVVISGTATVDVEFAIQKDLSGSVDAIQHDQLNSLTTSTASLEDAPVTAFRLNVTSYTSGDITLRILQGG